MLGTLERRVARARLLFAARAARAGFALLLASGSVAAQSEPAGSPSALAEALFQEGKAFLEAGDLSAACPKFAESFRLESALGTLLNLAVCHERQGKTASAWSEYADALAMAERTHETERAQFARLRVQELQASVPRLRLHVQEPEAGPQIKLDGQALGAGAWDSAIPLDPGTHFLEASALGRKPWAAAIELRQASGTQVVDVPRLVEAHVGAPSTEAHSTGALPAAAHSTEAVRARRLWGTIAGGVALLGFGAGTFWGVRVATQQQQVERNCSGRLCNEVGMAADRAAHQAATWADISFGAGLAAGALSAYLLLSTPRAPGPTARPLSPSERASTAPSLAIDLTPGFRGIHALISF